MFMEILKLKVENTQIFGRWEYGAFLSYSLGVRRFLNIACMKMSLRLFYNPVLKEEKG